MTETIDETGGEQYDVVLLPEDMAHIVFPQVPIDLKALALCGKKWKPKQYNADVPVDMFTCPDCVEESVALLVEAHGALTLVMERLAYIQEGVEGTSLEVADSIPRLLDTLRVGNEYADKQEAKVIAKLNRRLDKEAEKAERLGVEERERADEYPIEIGDMVVSTTDGKTYEVTGLDSDPNYLVVKDFTGKRKVRSRNTLVH
jgi:hypothetical protein